MWPGCLAGDVLASRPCEVTQHLTEHPKAAEMALERQVAEPSQGLAVGPLCCSRLMECGRRRAGRARGH